MSFDSSCDTIDGPCGILSSLCSFSRHQTFYFLLLLSSIGCLRARRWRNAGIGAGSGWAFVHPYYTGIEKRTETWIDNLLLFAHLEFSCFRRLWMPAAAVAAKHHPSMCSRSTHVARIEMKNEPEFPFFSTKCTNSTHETDPWTSCLSWIHKSILSYHRVLHGYMLALL